VPFIVSCDETCQVTIQLLVDRATARKLGIDKKAKGAVQVGRIAATVGAARSKKLTVKLNAKARRGIKRSKRVKLAVRMKVVDLAGNATSPKVGPVTLRR
jgi:hypothetical protein